MTDTNAITAAVAHIKQITPEGETWDWGDFAGPMSPQNQIAFAEIASAVASGALVPAADVQGLQDALRRVTAERDEWQTACSTVSASLAIKVADAEAEVATLRAKVEALGRDLNRALYGEPHFGWEMHKDAMSDLRARAEAAEAEVARLTAELAAARGRVKPLEWREVNDGNRRKGEVFGTRSPVSFAPITAHKKHDGWWLSADCKTYPTLEAAKAAAQADYAARILATLEPDPAMARMREALEEIARQKRTDELETELDAEHADFEGGYDACIDRARAALQEE